MKPENAIKTVTFISAGNNPDKCPGPDRPEYAFIGRSNVGKSSLLNMIAGRKSLARISVSPGKTQTINHYLVNDAWYLVDLPGYGYAKVSKTMREKWTGFTKKYLIERPNLMCLFQLVDSRIEPQAADLGFSNFLGENKIPFVLAFTKSDKVTTNILNKNIAAYSREMSKSWEQLPRQFITSSQNKKGREELLAFIQQTNLLFNRPGTNL
ncbi:MAG: ribosome biogenesis GTP-binding protein YihA/YsxC [Bacteroidales bacterium]